MREPPTPPVDDPRAVIGALVALALDDLEDGNLGLEDALHALATAAWTAGRESAADLP